MCVHYGLVKLNDMDKCTCNYIFNLKLIRTQMKLTIDFIEVLLCTFIHSAR